MDSQNRSPRGSSFRGRRPASSGPRKTGGFSRRPRPSSGGSYAPSSSGAYSAGPRSPSSSFRSGGGDRRPSYRSGGERRPSYRGGGGGGFSSRGRSGGGRGGARRSTFDVSQYINRNPVQAAPEEIYVPKHQFTDFGFSATLASLVAQAGLVTPSPIQDQIIPFILDGRDAVGLANTGTGKTAAFLLPLIQRALVNDKSEVLILTPTRELALQVEQELRKLSHGMRLFSTTCVGGTNIWQQITRLKRKNHFVIGTPGRINDLIERRAFNPAFITAVVLDEADRMLDMGFIEPIRQILKHVPSERNTLFFSATMSPNIEKLVHDFLKNPAIVSVKKKDITGLIEQDVVHHTPADKFPKLVELLKRPEFTRVIIFGSMKHSVEKLSRELTEQGIPADSIHGNKSQSQRQRALARFKAGDIRVLVATDVAARGIHVDRVSHVINYDLPATYEDYVHRIGRTGRGIHLGKALTFVR